MRLLKPAESAAEGRRRSGKHRLWQLALTLLLCAPTATAAETLRVGIYPNPPKIFQNSTGEAAGFFPQVLNALAADEGWQLQYQSCEWQQCLEQIEKGQLDLLPDVAWSPERATRYRFNSEPVLTGWSEVYTRHGVDVQRISDLKGLQVLALKGSVQWDALDKLNQDYALGLQRVPADNFAQTFHLLENKQADAAVVNQWFGHAAQPYYAVKDTPLQLFPVQLHLIAAEELPASLLQRIDQRLRSLKQQPDGVYQQALQDLMQYQLDPKIQQRSALSRFWRVIRQQLDYTLLLQLLLGGLGLLLLILGWSFSLRRQIERRTAELKASQADIMAHESQLRQIIEHTPVAMALVDDKGQILQLNRAFTELLGYTSAELQHLNDWWPLAYPDPVYQQQKQADWPAELTKPHNSYEDLIQARDGSQKHLLVRFQTLGSQRVFTFVDQSAQKLRESELVSSLQTSERILNATQELARLGGWELDLQAGTIWWTDGLYHLHGLPADRSSLEVQASVNKSLHCYQPESARQELLQLFERCQQYGEAYDRQYRFQPYQGPEIWVRAFAQPVLENGQVIRILGVVKDISVQKANEAALEQARSQAEQAARTKALFLANMSHEIRTPMNAILGFSQLLQQQLSDPRWREYLNIICKSGEHLLQLINEILDLSKIEAGKLVLHAEALQLSELLEEIRFLLALDFEAKGLDFSVSLDGEAPEWLLLDRQRLRQVLLNLLSNALKFTDSGSVQLRAHCEPAPAPAGGLALVFEVCDTGRGIAPEDQQRIFKAFEQASSSLSPWQVQGSGTGLGLSISQALVQLMQGQITVHSTPGEGSCFKITLPSVAAASAPVQNPLSPALILQDFAPASLLLTDDQPNNLLLLQSLLSSGPFQLFSARNGLEACQLARQKLPDLILMDVRMPVMDGVEALKYLRADLSTQKIPLIALTAFSLPGEQQKLLAEGFDGYLSKPFKQSDLLAALSRFLPLKVSPEHPSATHTPKLSAALDAVTATDKPPLTPDAASAAALQGAWQTRWEAVSESWVLSELEDFVTDFIAWPALQAYLPLQQWLHALQQTLERFDLEAAHTLLQDWPARRAAALQQAPEAPIQD